MTTSANAPASGDDVGGAAIVTLPHPLTSLIGREAVVQATLARLANPSTRLLTFVGPGGIGKSRLALEVAHRISDRFADGALLIRFAAVSDSGLVRFGLARALGIGNPDFETQVWAVARDRHLLLLIDNFEQLLPAALDIVDVLSQCPRVTMLITSRVPLHVTGEHEVRVPPLATPGSPIDARAGDAVQLFVERASPVDSGFSLTNENRETIAQIVRQLDGLPLAIELAAAQSRHLPPSVILERLRDATDLLQGGPIDLPPHQRAMGETIAWSYDLLDDEEKIILRRLAVFTGGFLPRSADWVCRDTDDVPRIHDLAEPLEFPNQMLDICIALADKSLIYRTLDHHGEPRFAMLLTIRQFGRGEVQRSHEYKAVQTRHATWFLAFALRARLELDGDDQTRWLAWVDQEHPNLRLALEWFAEAESWQSYAQLANAISRYWIVYGHHAEGLGWLQMAIDMTIPEEIGTTLYGDVLGCAGWLAFRLGRAKLARQFADRAQNAARAEGSSRHLAEALRLLGSLEVRSTAYERAATAMREALTTYRALGDTANVNDMLISLGGVDLNLGQYRLAEQRFRDVLSASTSPIELRTHARAWDMIGLVLYVEGRASDALPYAEKAHTLYRQAGDLRGMAIALDHVGKCERAMGNGRRAWQCHQESLPLRHKVGDPRGFAVWLEAVAGLLVCCHDFEAAAEILAAVEILRSDGQFPVYGQEQHDIDWATGLIRKNVSPSRLMQLRRRGSQRVLVETIEFASTQAAQAVVAQNRQPAVVPDRHGLTGREREILDGLRRRLTDREIAEELSISPRTVSTHVASILGKMNLKSRRDVPASGSA